MNRHIALHAITFGVFFASGLVLPTSGHARDVPSAPRPTPKWAVSSDPNRYEDSLGTTLAYDQQLNDRTYDDGYGPHVHIQFEAALAPHGTWIDTSELGRVWIPSATETGRDFWPYRTGGHWALTEFGWTWSSDWAWGWAPFHYGRWAYLSARGWCWVPGTLWAPAWVAWRIGKGYVAWAPLPPKGMNLARPLGTLSPWWMIRSRTLGPSPEFVPRREVPALFSLTTAISIPKELMIGRVVDRINTGPSARACCGRRLRPGKLADVAPHAAPALTIEPRPGASLEDRPWTRSGFVDQAPISLWPTSDTPANGS